MQTLPDGSVQVSYQLLLIVGGIVGLVCGLVPLGLGIAKRRAKLGVIGFVVCLLVGVPFSLLGALPAAIIFAVLISRSAKKTEIVEEPPQEIV